MYRIITYNFTCRSLLNTIWRIRITNSSIYMNTTISTINFTIYINTISITTYSTRILMKTWSFSLNNSSILINTICRILITNISIYINTTIRTSNFIKYINTISITTYSSIILIKTCLSSLDSSTFLINTIFRIINITDICIYINSTIRTSNFTNYINTIWTILKWNIWTY